ncbi:rhodanese-like domain-containing protein [Microlunatus aurantiacus]|uniref:Rhodanese-like domain-containing protein n=1 Tax=Microlunatus aurantiacus TaxID=446786 RepID=A0ABP7ECD5_9ACTN
MPTSAPTEFAPTEVDPTTLIDWMKDPDAVTVLDVRSPAEFETRHITGSYNLSLDLVGEHAAQLAGRLDRKVVLVCQSGVRAGQAQQRLAGTGMDNLHVLTAGVTGYSAAGGQVVHGRPRWSLERQVRLVAGGLVVAGVVASRWAPKAAGLAGAVGTGLTISALTDTCTMGRVLAALPYNRGTHTDAQQLLNQLPSAARS